MTVETDGINKPNKIYYNFVFYKETKTTFGLTTTTENAPCITDQQYIFVTNGDKIPEEKFSQIEQAIYNIINS